MGQGPWGQGGGPRRPNQGGGGGRGPNPPDLDDLIRKGQDRLKQVLPSGGGGRMSWILPVVLLAGFGRLHERLSGAAGRARRGAALRHL